MSLGADWVVSSERQSAPRSGRAASEFSDVILVFDGGSRGNPGQGYGSFVYKGRVVRWQTNVEYPDKKTNNQAEYLTLIAGLRAILFDCESLDLPIEELAVEVRSDSQLLVNQLTGRWKVKNQELKRLHGIAGELLASFDRWKLIWHPRSESVRILGH